ncbi:MAG: hypothetical protein H6933_20460 [Burkholderiaceae bacterium]|nr:hypothetical protein [Burkholderiaceae bacterium]
MTAPAASPAEAARPQDPTQSAAHAERLWADLLARLTLALQASQQPQARDTLRACGIRRPGTAVLNLLRERDMAGRMALAAGVRLAPRMLHRRVGELARPAPFAGHLADLADAYAGLCSQLKAHASPELFDWLCARQRMHRQQADVIAAAMGSTPSAPAWPPPGPPAHCPPT